VRKIEQTKEYGTNLTALTYANYNIKITLEQATKVQRGSKGISTLSLTSALEGVDGQRHAPTALPPVKRPGTHCTGGWVGPRANMNG
jgi:hypothetical protein